MSNLNSYLNNFVSKHLSPTDGEKQAISKAYKQLSDLLKGYNFQSGSYARFTAITPVHDLDVIWELPVDLGETARDSISKKINPYQLDISNILSDLAKKLTSEYNRLGEKVNIEAQTHSITIELHDNKHDFAIDVVPALLTNDSNEYGDYFYQVPEILRLPHRQRTKKYFMKDKIDWINSDPKGYIKEATKLNEITESYRKATKFLKAWKYKVNEENDNIKLKSFHIEQIVISILGTQNLDSFRTIKEFYKQIENFISSPQIKDRADKNRYIDNYVLDLSENQKIVIIKNAKETLDLISTIDENSPLTEIQNIFEKLCIKKKSDVLKIYPIIKQNVPTKPWNENH